MKLTARAEHLLAEIRAGRDRIFAADARPPGFLQLERAGLVRREGDRAVLVEQLCEECGKDTSDDGECGPCGNCRVPLCMHGAPLEKRARYDLTCDLWGKPGEVEKLEQAFAKAAAR